MSFTICFCFSKLHSSLSQAALIFVVLATAWFSRVIYQWFQSFHLTNSCFTICKDVSNSSTSPSSYSLISTSSSAKYLVFWWQLWHSFHQELHWVFCGSIVLPFHVLYCVSHLATFPFCDCCRCCNMCCVFWKTNHYRTANDICKLLLQSLQSLITLLSTFVQFYSSL